MLRGVRLPYVPGDVPQQPLRGESWQGLGRYPGAGIWPALGTGKVERVSWMVRGSQLVLFTRGGLFQLSCWVEFPPSPCLSFPRLCIVLQIPCMEMSVGNSTCGVRSMGRTPGVPFFTLEMWKMCLNPNTASTPWWLVMPLGPGLCGMDARKTCQRHGSTPRGAQMIP